MKKTKKTEAPNIDDIVDYKEEYGKVIKEAKISGDQMTGLCPFHDDKKASFSVTLKTGCWTCFAEDISGNYIDFYAKLHGLMSKEAYKRILHEHGYDEEKPEVQKNPEKTSYTLEQYASEKNLPAEWLEGEFHLKTSKDYNGVSFLKFPYYKKGWEEATYRKRYGNKDFRWKQGSSGKICLYGEWKLSQFLSEGYAVLVEGESDTQSLWYMGINALGVPGASMFKPSMTASLQGLEALYIHQEPDSGGAIFVQKVMDGLKKGGFVGDVYRISCSDIDNDIKDPSDLYIKYKMEAGAKMIRDLMDHAESVSLDQRVDADASVMIEIEDAPSKLLQPKGWQCSDNGVSQINKKTGEPTLVCRTPLIITRRLKNIVSKEEKIEIAFKRDGEWIRAILPRSTIFTAREIVTLSDLGCMVSSENARKVVQYLEALEAENIDLIKRVDSTNKFGWQPGPGKRFIPGVGKDIVMDVDPNKKKLQAAYTQMGSREAWIEFMQLHRERDGFRFMLAAGLGPPLLRILKQRSFIVYKWGESRSGKTAALKATLSEWGDPEQLMVNFNATQVGIERIASFFCDLPLGIDERQLAGKQQEGLEKLIYMISNGSGKIRGTKTGGIQEILTWLTIAIATGEEPISIKTSQTGVSTRIIEITGRLFEDENDAAMMHQMTSENYGIVGPEFIMQVRNVSEQSIIDKYKEMEEYLTSVAQGSCGAHISEVAVVALADAMADTWIFKGELNGTEDLRINPESWERAKKMAVTILTGQQALDNGDVNERAVKFLIDWVNSNQNHFGDTAVGECYGTMSDDKEIAYIYASQMDKALEKEGFSPEKTRKYLKDNGSIGITKRKDRGAERTTVQKYFDGRNQWFVEFYIKNAEELVYGHDKGHGNDRSDMSSQCMQECLTFSEDGFVKLPEEVHTPFD